MLKQIKMNESVGRTIIRFGPLSPTKSTVAVVFADGTFAALAVDRGYESGDEEIVDGDFCLLSHMEAALRLGIATPEDAARHDQEMKENERFVRELAEKRELSEYQRLKAKFEGGK